MLGLVRKLSAYLIIPLTWTIFTIVLLCLPGSSLPSIGLGNIPLFDKMVHFTLFGLLVFFWSYFFYQKASFSRWRKIVLFFVGASIMFGILLEFVQYYFVPNRDFDTMDMLADSLGAVFFGGLLRIVERKNNFKKQL